MQSKTTFFLLCILLFSTHTFLFARIKNITCSNITTNYNALIKNSLQVSGSAELKDLTVSGAATFLGNITIPGGLPFEKGTAANPSVTFSGNTTTGLSAADTNTLVLSTNGTSALTFSPTQTATFANGLTVTTGGATIAAGGLTVTAGGAIITAGGLTVNAGGATINGLLNANGGIAVGTDVFTVADTSGNTIISGSLNCGNQTLSVANGQVGIGTFFSVVKNTGATTIGGLLKTTGGFAVGYESIITATPSPTTVQPTTTVLFIKNPDFGINRIIILPQNPVSGQLFLLGNPKNATTATGTFTLYSYGTTSVLDFNPQSIDPGVSHLFICTVGGETPTWQCVY